VKSAAGDSVQDTIVARATPRGASALSVIRLSGPRAVHIAAAVFSGKDLRAQASHTAHVGLVGEPGDPIDQVVCTLFLAPSSATGEDVVEFSCHGSDVASDALIRLLVSRGARMAEPGEFTLRAFLNGKVDLAQAEGIAELIHAQSERAGRISMAHLRGRFSEELNVIRDRLVELVSLLELELDFSEEDVAFADRDRLVGLLAEASDRLSALTGSFRFGQALSEGVRVVIVGRPNAGKSTLMNALLGYDRVIVSDIPGTTRDEVEASIVKDGIRLSFVDTAGRRETEDRIEAEGVRRGRDAEQSADLVLELLDLSDPAALLNREEGSTAIPRLRVGNKVDVSTGTGDLPVDLVISALSMRRGDEPVEPLLEAILKQTVGDVSFDGEHHVVTSMRQQAHIRAARSAIDRVQEGVSGGASGDMLSADIRRVIDEIGAVTGVVTNEDILDQIFSRFCIGK
jgi:tRNA modification GTPase